MRYTFLGFLLAISILFGACEKSTKANCPSACAVDNLQHVRRVLLLGIDGCRPDALQKANTPNLDKLMTDGRYSFNVNRGDHDTWSGAGWSTMLTGVWPNKHGVHDNLFGGKNYGQYPHFLCRFKENNNCFKTASIVHYSDLNKEIAAPCNADVLLDYNKDALVAEATTNYLKDCNLDVIMVHFDDVDHAGHTRGFHPDIPQYIQAIEGVDTYIGKILEAVYAREANNNEDWLIIVSTDHGGKIDGTHGFHNNDPEVTRVFSIFRNRNTVNKGLMSYDPPLVDIVPTIFDHLSIPVDSSWALDGTKVDL